MFLYVPIPQDIYLSILLLNIFILLVCTLYIFLALFQPQYINNRSIKCQNFDIVVLLTLFPQLVEECNNVMLLRNASTVQLSITVNH